MKAVFLVNRINNYRHFASLIDEGLKRNHSIECWHDYSFRKDSAKGYLFPEINNAPFHEKDHPFLRQIPIFSQKALNDRILSANDVTYFVSLSPPEFILDSESLNKFRGSWCIIMHGPDSFKEIKNIEKTDIRSSFKRYFFPYTKYMFDMGTQFYEKFIEIGKTYFSPPNAEVHPIGCNMFGSVLKKIDQNKVRRKFGIPERKNILLYLPYTFSGAKKHKRSFAWQAAFAGLHIERRISKEFDNNSFNRDPFGRKLSRQFSYLRRILPDKEAREWLLKSWNEPEVIKAAKAFCERNDLYLVVKPRRKFDFSEEVYKKADIIIDDDESQQYPSKLQELFTVASLCMGYFSTTVIESVFCNVPFVNLHCPDMLFHDPHQHFWCPVTDDSLFSFNGAVWNTQIPELISKMPSQKLSYYSMKTESRKRFMLQFTGLEEPTAGKCFYNYLENRISS